MSETTPPKIENRKLGNLVANTVSPSIKRESVFTYITHGIAVFCIHVPIKDMDCPVKNNL
jgi:hypothetical protein